jgi:hypothetical protein
VGISRSGRAVLARLIDPERLLVRRRGEVRWRRDLPKDFLHFVHADLNGFSAPAEVYAYLQSIGLTVK